MKHAKTTLRPNSFALKTAKAATAAGGAGAATFAAALALAALLALPAAPDASAQSANGARAAGAAAGARPAAKPALATTAEAPKARKPIFFYWRTGDKWDIWPVNDYFSGENSPKKGTIRPPFVVRTVTTGGSNMEEKKAIADIGHISWEDEPQPLEQARELLARGKFLESLTAVDKVVSFFDKVKTVQGSWWLDAASVKLEAAMQLKNDLIVNDLIAQFDPIVNGSIQTFSDDKSVVKIERLKDRIRLARIDQMRRKGDIAAVLRECEAFIKDSVNPETLAQVHLIKGECQLEQKKYEAAMNTFLRVSVFYGSSIKDVPAAQLGAVKAFKGMNSPQNRHLRLEDVANRYLNDIITRFPLTKEAEIAKKMLTKEEREKAIERADATTEAAINAAETATANSAGTTPAPAPDTDAAPAAETPAPAAETPAGE
ncbi:MAG: hypothetical protein LBR07_09855 [Puniceicoccales bacterium]|jgi:hypothetical protein|nr:hypothetical protein [Puniceicoccales bacterium]